MALTVTDYNALREHVRGIAELIVEDIFNDYLAAPKVNLITREQRLALFGSFTDVFGQANSEQRYAFTRLVLEKPGDAVVSWSEFKDGALTADEAETVLAALDLLNV